MGEFIVEDVRWKKGETGIQKFILFESDGVTRRNGTGLSYEFKFWKRGSGILEGGGAMSQIDAILALYNYSVLAADTDSINNFIGEIIEDPVSTKIKSDTFNVIVAESSDFT